MKIAFGADEKTHLTDALVDALRLRGHEVELFGPPAGEPGSWADVARSVGERVAMNRADQGVLCCWTGTGVSIAANKVPGVRAALCADAETARGARLWNDANVLCLSLRATTESVGREILDAWLAAAPDGSETDNIEKVRMMDIARGPL
jgi:ribose 5-phosphate isomerase B